MPINPYNGIASHSGNTLDPDALPVQSPFNAPPQKSAAASIAAAVLPVVISAISQHMTNRQNERIHNSDMQFAAEQARLSFEREATYNDPKNYMQRLQTAGLNPNLALGGLGSANSSAAQTPSALPMQSVFNDPLSMSQAMLNLAQARNVNADTENKPVVAEKMRAEIENYASQNEQNRAWVKLLRSQKTLTDVQVLQGIEYKKQITAQTELIYQHKNESIERVKQIAEDIKLKGEQSKYYQQLWQALQLDTLIRQSTQEEEVGANRANFELSKDQAELYKQVFEDLIFKDNFFRMMQAQLSAEASQAEMLASIENKMQEAIKSHKGTAFAMPEMFFYEQALKMITGEFSLQGVLSTAMSAVTGIYGASALAGARVTAAKLAATPKP